jgi:protoporphyrinogen/coproporphyrinogen III oxidase
VIAVLGGGITGLATAYELARRGLAFTLVEASDTLGGLIRTERIGGFTLDAGPDSLLAQKPAAIELCEELGIAHRLMPTTPPRTAYVLKHGRLHPLPSPSVLGLPTTMGAVARYDLLSWRARARLAWEPMVPRQARDDESVASFFRRRFGPETVHLIAEPLLGGIHAGDIEVLSIASLFPRLVEAERKTGGVLRNLAPRTTPPEGGLFRALRSGMGELVDTIAARLPAEAVLRNSVVEGLERRSGSWRVRTTAGAIDADAVMLTLPAHAAARIIAPIDARGWPPLFAGALRLDGQHRARLAARGGPARARRERLRGGATIQSPAHHGMHLGIVEVGGAGAGRTRAAARVRRRGARSGGG